MSQVRTFRAATAREALGLVRDAFGADALILGHREVKSRPFPWYRVVVETEVTAGLGIGGRLGQREEGSHPADSAAEKQRRVERRQLAQPSGRPSQATSPSTAGSVGRTNQQLREPPTLTGWNPYRLYTRLIETGVDTADARQIADRLSQSIDALRSGEGPAGVSDRKVLDLLRREFPKGAPIACVPGRRRVVALIGATGVGKTTSLAKLAACYRLRERLSVGLITIDNFRVAAVDQLRTYADLLEVPLRVVTSPREMPQALQELATVDLVLIDTAGRSPNDVMKLKELRSYLQAAQADEIQLVLSLTSDRRLLERTVEAFAPLRPTGVLLTKSDELTGPGGLLSAVRHLPWPVSYVTTGQEVPDDLESFNQNAWAAAILGIAAETNDDAVRDRETAAAASPAWKHEAIVDHPGAGSAGVDGESNHSTSVRRWSFSGDTSLQS